MASMTQPFAPASTTSLAAANRSIFLNRRTVPSLKKTIQLYKAQLHRLEAKHDQLLLKRSDLKSRAFVVLEESTREPSSRVRHTTGTFGRRSVERSPEIRIIEASVQVEGSDRPKNDSEISELPSTTLVEQPDAYHSDVSSLVATATSILIESVELRLGFIRSVLAKLNTLYQEEPKVATPPELGFERYEEWVGSNQRLLELNVQLYEIESLKFELKKKKSFVRKAKKKSPEEDGGLIGSMFLKNSVQRIQSFLARFSFETPLQDRTVRFLQELLDPRGDKTTLESQKVDEYVEACRQNMDTPIETVIGGHPQAYQQFMAILCNYIVEKQKEVQGEQLPYALVHSTVERHVIPKILPAVMRHISQSERDRVIESKCEQFADITLSQLRVHSKYHSKELIPFFESITQLRASYFSPTPTDKMYAILAAAKALYERLGSMGEASIDGDSFLDLWVYVILKAKVKDLATNLYFMAEYGNPMLAMDEAGYYLTSLEAAVAFIERLDPSQLCTSGVPTDFVVCECSKFRELSLHPSACFTVIKDRVELPGYRVGVVRKWAMNRAKLVSGVLINTGDSSDVAIVSVIRFSLEYSCAPHTEYFTNALRGVGMAHGGLFCDSTPLGLGIIADTANMNPHSLLVLPTGDYDANHTQLTHLLQLIYLGSEDREDFSQFAMGTSNAVNDEFLYLGTPPLDKQLTNQKRSRLLSDSLQIPTTRSVPVQGRRALSFNNKRAENSFVDNLSPSMASSPYLAVGHGSQVSLSSLAADSLSKTPTKPHRKNSWFSRKFRSKKEKSGTNRQSNTSTDHHRDVSNQYPTNPRVEITSEYTSSSSQYTRSGGRATKGGYLAVSSTDSSPDHASSGRVVQTVQVEVHESLTTPTPSGHHPLDSVVVDSHNLSIRNALFDSSIELDGSGEGGDSSHTQNPSLDALSSALHPSSASSDEEVIVKPRTLSTKDFVNSSTLSLSSQMSSSLGEDPFLKVSEQFFSEDNVRFLEGNFRANHMVTGDCECVEEAVRSVVRQAQLFLQRLNYLSVSCKIDGLYTHSTLSAVQRFQQTHNAQPRAHLLPLPENGHMTAAYFQYLRQVFMTVYANMIRIGLDKNLGVNFDPTSTDEKDINHFKDCVQKFQESSDLIGRCQLGVLCSSTVEKIRHILSTRQ